MTISYELKAALPTSDEYMSVVAVLQNDTPSLAYRRVEVQDVPRTLAGDEAAIVAHVGGRYTLQQLWGAGAVTSEDEFTRAELRPREAYFWSILRAIDNARRDEEPVETALVAAKTAINVNTAQRARFNAYAAWMALPASPATDTEKALALLLAMTWAQGNLLHLYRSQV